MGKVVKFDTVGYPGTISRAHDIVVEAKKNVDTDPIAFGAPVMHHASQNGVTNWTSTATADRFVGFAVRNPAKTPATGSSSEGSYAAGELVDVIKRGDVIVPLSSGTPKVGGAVYIVKATGGIVAAADDTNTLQLTNCRFHSIKDANGNVEITITERQF